MRYTYVRQHDSTDCAAASLAMVCLHYKKEITITRLRDMMGTDMKGTNLVGLQKAANELGFSTAAVRVDRENFLSDFTLPAIAQVITDQGMTHFVVIFKKTTIKEDDARRKHVVQEEERKADASKKYKCKDYVVIGDPANELKKISLDEFYKNFTGVLLLLNPTAEFKGGTGKHKVEGKEEAKAARNNMLKRYMDLLLPQKKLFAYAILSSVILTLIGIVSTVFNKAIMDEVLPYGLKNLLISLIVVFSVVNLTSTLLSTVRQWILIFLSIKIDIPLMLGYFEHVYKLPMKFFASRKTGEITTRYSDAGTIKSVLTSIAMSVVMDIVMAVGTGFVLFRMNSSLFSITLFTTVLSLLLVTGLLTGAAYKRINEETMVQSAVLNSQMIESLRGIETIKCNACEERELEALEREYIKSLKISLRSSKISTGQSLISSVIMTVLNMVTTYVGITQVLNGQLTLGGYMAFSTLSGYFTSPVSELISMQMSIQEASISMKRLTEIMDYESEQDDDREYTEMESMEGDIEFKDVTFRYGNRTPALDHISFTIPQGKKVALVGSSGSGKSTITKLLLKYYEPESGTISVNGVDLDEYSNASVRRCISYVPQNVELFSKTIFENIRISRPEATLDQVREAAKKADAHEFIRKLPLQYNTYLEEAGNGLSGGEKQRIALARAFLKDSSLYIFDESTSSLDFGTENTIFDMIYNQLADRSMLIVAHRLSTIRDCDLILVMDHGQIVERGTHDELLAKQGKYYELWNLQQGIFRRKKEEPAPVAPAAVVEEDDDGEAMTY